MSARSYVPRREGRSFEQELARLESQVALSWAEEARLIGRLGMAGAARVLEVGCGPGHVMRRVLDEWPDAHVTGIDHDAELLAHAEAALTARRPRVALAHGDAGALPCGDGTFDIVLMRYLLQHLPKPVAAVREAHRVLKPGGRMIAIDNDAACWGVAEPSFPEVAPIVTRTGPAQAARGGYRLIGRRLHRVLSAGGFADARLDVFAYHSDSVGLAAFDPQLSADRLLPFVRDGVITEADFAVVADAHRRFRESPTPFILMIGFVGSGTRS